MRWFLCVSECVREMQAEAGRAPSDQFCPRVREYTACDTPARARLGRITVSASVLSSPFAHGRPLVRIDKCVKYTLLFNRRHNVRACTERDRSQTEYMWSPIRARKFEAEARVIY